MGLGAAPYYRGRARAQNRRVPRWIVAGTTAVVLAALTVVFGSTFVQVYRLEREAARMEQLKRDLEAQNAQLREEIQLLHTPQYIEKLAREQLGLVKPGEIALLIVQTPPDPLPQQPARPRSGWTRRLWDALRRLFGR